MTNYRNLAIAVVAIISMSFMAHAATDAMAGVIMQDGKVMLMKDGKATEPLAQEMTMTDGGKITPDGTVKTPDGKVHRLMEGQMMTMDGKMVEGGTEMKDHEGMKGHKGMKDHKDMKKGEMGKPN